MNQEMLPPPYDDTPPPSYEVTIETHICIQPIEQNYVQHDNDNNNDNNDNNNDNNDNNNNYNFIFCFCLVYIALCALPIAMICVGHDNSDVGVDCSPAFNCKHSNVSNCHDITVNEQFYGITGGTWMVVGGSTYLTVPVVFLIIYAVMMRYSISEIIIRKITIIYFVLFCIFAIIYSAISFRIMKMNDDACNNYNSDAEVSGSLHAVQITYTLIFSALTVTCLLFTFIFSRIWE